MDGLGSGKLESWMDGWMGGEGRGMERKGKG